MRFLFFYTPLIAAMAGNVGVQSSAIIVQGLANNDLKGSVGNRLLKEMLLALLNGSILAVALFLFTWGVAGSFTNCGCDFYLFNCGYCGGGFCRHIHSFIFAQTRY